jgi:hypothetical protein
LKNAIVLATGSSGAAGCVGILPLMGGKRTGKRLLKTC